MIKIRSLMLSSFLVLIGIVGTWNFAEAKEVVGSDIKIVASCEKTNIKIGEPIIVDVKIEYLGKDSLTFQYCFTKDDAYVSDLHVVVECTEKCRGYGLLDKDSTNFSKPRTIELGPNSYFGTKIQIILDTVSKLPCIKEKDECKVYFVFSKGGINIESNRISIKIEK